MTLIHLMSVIDFILRVFDDKLSHNRMSHGLRLFLCLGATNATAIPNLSALVLLVLLLSVKCTPKDTEFPLLNFYMPSLRSALA